MDFGVEKIDLTTVHFTPELVRTIPAATVRMYRVLPVFDAPDCLCIALPDASKLEVIDELHFILRRSLEVRQAERQQLDTFIQRLYGDDDR
jgi:type II secretory ATPase GspE/PulE/Tfp pilus assembly ATPase PilB-like protein